jgi:hypothetical protein
MTELGLSSFFEDEENLTFIVSLDTAVRGMAGLQPWDSANVADALEKMGKQS